VKAKWDNTTTNTKTQKNKLMAREIEKTIVREAIIKDNSLCCKFE
jgi:hypothetical protein